MMRVNLAFVAAALLLVAAALSGVEGSQTRLGEQPQRLRGEGNFERRLQGSCGGGGSDWSSEGNVDISGNTYTFRPGSNERAERKRVENREEPGYWEETLRYTGSVRGMEEDTGLIIFQFHRDGGGDPPTAVKVYYDNRYRDDSTFDIYLRCNDGDGETDRMVIDGGYRNGDSFTLEASINNRAQVSVSVGGSSRSCSISGFGDAIYPKFGAYTQGGSGSYGDVVAEFRVQEYSCE